MMPRVDCQLRNWWPTASVLLCAAISACAPRAVAHAGDLTFGEISRLLQVQGNFARLGLRVGKASFTEMLEAVRRMEGLGSTD